MVFQPEGYFRQFSHCKFKENVVRLLYIPTLEDGSVFLVVNKFGKIGLYEPTRFGLIHTFCLDLSVPMHPVMSNTLRNIASKERSTFSQAKCERTHLVVDAVYAPDLQMVLFATTKSLIQCYDIGEIENQSLGLEILPRKEFMGLRHEVSPAFLKNKGHVETHRIFDLDTLPSCMEYFCPQQANDKGQHFQHPGKSGSKLLIGDMAGGVTIVQIDNPNYPFLGHRKIRGILHKITMTELRNGGKVKSYRGHMDPVKDIRFLSERQWIVSCSRDQKFSLFCEDCTEIEDSFIISLPKGVRSLVFSDILKMIGTGSEDGVIRIFSQFSMKMPQTELLGHRSSIIALEFLQVPFSENPILISFSSDVEIRAWDPVKFICLQNLYFRFPPKSTIICKTPEFAKRSLIIHQPHFYSPPSLRKNLENSELPTKHQKSKTSLKKTPRYLADSNTNKHGSIILLYCNSYAQLTIENDTSHWPFDFDEFLTDFEAVGINFDRKLARRLRSESKDPNLTKLSREEELRVEAEAKTTTRKLMKLKSTIHKDIKTFYATHTKPTHGFRTEDKIKGFSSQMEEMIERSTSTVFNQIPFYDISDPKINPDLFPSNN